MTIDITYGPEAWARRARILSALSLIGLIVAVEVRRRRGRFREEPEEAPEPDDAI